MGDRTAVAIEIGGRLPASALDELVQAIAEEAFGLDWEGPAPTADELRQAIEPGKPLRVMDNETYASMDAIAAVCRARGLLWRMCWDAYPGSYAAGAELHDAEGDTEYSVDGTDGTPMLSLPEIETLGSWEALTARLARLGASLPAFEIVPDAA